MQWLNVFAIYVLPLKHISTKAFQKLSWRLSGYFGPPWSRHGRLLSEMLGGLWPALCLRYQLHATGHETALATEGRRKILDCRHSSSLVWCPFLKAFQNCYTCWMAPRQVPALPRWSREGFAGLIPPAPPKDRFVSVSLFCYYAISIWILDAANLIFLRI